ncbi:hypothetical protein MPTK1_3g23550 [Marchantia polymorpha subsp. ruderalis]|uniref:Uncharacterized protein n=2 Tax=Marchantia polymorpha TaxID=3197 RepID=A0AAF6B410_MARPO|nr:hypothetical protein MARPO_0024s0131 [Marchantia polymorpha]BBN06744.1 hypothetical protein Mp_3g23550 [Marchantia polymorpha subsp. ruderalis]|eukprot:PTQ43643.1 hypothetical protein MARPO_0024s0131 [Marchantia polymorpha]
MGVGSEADLGVESSVRRAIGRSRRDRNDGCYHSPPSNSVCSLDKNETGKNVQICQKTEKVLRRCAGSDWDRERLNAEGLLRCLSEEYVEEEKQRRGLLKRWPEAPCTEDSVSSPNAERYIPEVLLRDDDEDSFHFLQTFIRRCVNELRHGGKVDQVVHDGQHEIAESLLRLSDQGVIEAIPGLLEKVERKALLAIYSIVSGKNGDTRNRAYLVDRVSKIFNNVSPQQTQTDRMQDVVTIMRSPGSYKKVESIKFEVEAFFPVEAAHSALLQLEQLPLTGLHVMLATIKGRLPGKVGQLKMGANKDRLASRIRKAAHRHLEGLENENELPERLRQSLIVMSLSARYAFGNDGKLIDFLGPVSMEKQSLHYKLLSALSDINYVKHENLLLIYKEIEGRLESSSKTRTKTIRNKINRIFLDCLLNSEIRPVPENVMSAAGKLKVMMRQKIAVNTKSSGLYEKKDLRESMHVELEAVLRLSSHLQQIAYNVREFSGEGVFPTSESEKELRKMDIDQSYVEKGQMQQRSAEGGTPSLQDAGELQSVVPTSENNLDDELEAALSKQIQVYSFNQTLDSLNEEGLERTIESEKNCQHEAVSPEEATALKDVTRIGDEAAGVGYTLVGCALEEMSRLSGQSFIGSVRSYLRCGVKRPFQESEPEVEQDQVSIILSLAQLDSRISSRTMDRVRRRLVR